MWNRERNVKKVWRCVAGPLTSVADGNGTIHVDNRHLIYQCLGIALVCVAVVKAVGGLRGEEGG